MTTSRRGTKSDLGSDTSEPLLTAVVPVSASLKLQIVEALRTAIFEGKLAPGSRLVEREICEMLNVSRTSTREAFQQLESEGLIKTVPYRGRVVAGISKDEARYLYEVRAMLEGLAARCFVERASDDDIARLNVAYKELVKTAKRPGTKRFGEVLDAKERLYQILLDGSQNTVAADVMQQLNNRIRFLRASSLSVPDRIKESIAEVKAIVDAVTARDAEGAFQACVHHVQMAAKSALSLLEENDQDAED